MGGMSQSTLLWYTARAAGIVGVGASGRERPLGPCAQHPRPGRARGRPGCSTCTGSSVVRPSSSWPSTSSPSCSTTTSTSASSRCSCPSPRLASRRRRLGHRRRMYLLVAVELTSLARAACQSGLGRDHYIAFPLFLFASIHALTAGTDRSGALRLAVFGAGAVVGALTAMRAAEVARHGPARADAASAATARHSEAAMSAVAAAGVRTDERRLLRERRDGRPVTLAEHRSRYRPSPPGAAATALADRPRRRGRPARTRRRGLPTARKLAAVAGGAARASWSPTAPRASRRAARTSPARPRPTWSSTARRSRPRRSAPRGPPSASTAPTAGPCGAARRVGERRGRAPPPVESWRAPTRYVAGEESALVHWLERRRGQADPRTAAAVRAGRRRPPDAGAERRDARARRADRALRRGLVPRGSAPPTSRAPRSSRVARCGRAARACTRSRSASPLDALLARGGGDRATLAACSSAATSALGSRPTRAARTLGAPALARRRAPGCGVWSCCRPACGLAETRRRALARGRERRPVRPVRLRARRDRRADDGAIAAGRGERAATSTRCADGRRKSNAGAPAAIPTARCVSLRAPCDVFAADLVDHLATARVRRARPGARWPSATTLAEVARERDSAVDPSGCVGHGICAELLPEWITLDDWGYPIVEPRRSPPELLRQARWAVSNCPALALRLKRHRWGLTPQFIARQ